MPFDTLLADVQAESTATQTGLGAITLVKRFKNSFQVRGGNTGASVGHADQNLTSLLFGFDGNATLLCKARCIADQVENNLANARFVAENLRKIVGNVDLRLM